MTTKKQLRLENEELWQTVSQLRKNITKFEDEVKVLKTIINQLAIGIGYAEDPMLNRLIINLLNEYYKKED